MKKLPLTYKMVKKNYSLQPHTYYPASVWYQYVYQILYQHLHPHQSCQATTQHLLNHYLGYTSVHYILDTPLQTSPTKLASLHVSLHRLIQQEPLQYVLGYTYFLEQRFSIEKGIFIPRSETEQMVSHIQQQKHKPESILDLCTGSGCIALSLKKNYPQATVHAIDIDSHALQLARKNAKTLQHNVHYHLVDLLQHPPLSQKWDLIVSNPPYIPLSEKPSIQAHVRNYEPHQALFVPHHDPLRFYKRIGDIAHKQLSPKGHLYVEIHEKFAHATAQIFQNIGLKKITIHKDLHHKDRWITCRSPQSFI